VSTVQSFRGHAKKVLEFGQVDARSPTPAVEKTKSIPRMTRAASAASVKILVEADTPAPARPQLYDRDAALQRVGGDLEMLRQLVQIFREESKRGMEALRDGLRRGDASSVKLHAHTLRGSLAYFGADWATTLAQQLEAMARSGDLSLAEPVLYCLEDALRLLEPALDELMV
jgi:two-component system sensor histidine kinase/response regulator